MIQTLWFFIKIAFIVGVAVWVAMQPGSVEVAFMGYKVTLDAGLFFILILGLFLSVLLILRVLRAIFSVPTAISKYYQEDKRRKGFRALTRGLVAVAAGDVKKASHFSKQTKALLPYQNGLPVLLEAQAAQLRGEEGLAQNRFEHLMEDKDAAFLGIRGLLKSSIKEGHLDRALEFAKKAQKIHPKQGWVLQTVYDLEIKNGLWNDAIETGKIALKHNAMSHKKIIGDRVAIHLMRADHEFANENIKAGVRELEQAYKLKPEFVPTVTRLAGYYISNKKKRKAATMIERAWKKNPHPDLVSLWNDLAPEKTEKNSPKVLKWYEDLVAFKPDSAEGQMAAANAAMDLGYWGEAKAYLMVAEKIYPSARLFRLQAVVEQNSTHNEESINKLIEKASEALPDKTWICCETGLIYDEWVAIAMPHEAFNTVVWDYPGARIVQQNKLMANMDETMLLIDPAA